MRVSLMDILLGDPLFIIFFIVGIILIILFTIIYYRLKKDTIKEHRRLAEQAWERRMEIWSNYTREEKYRFYFYIFFYYGGIILCLFIMIIIKDLLSIIFLPVICGIAYLGLHFINRLDMKVRMRMKNSK